MIAHPWLTTGRISSPGWDDAPECRWITTEALGRAVTVTLAILMIPALLAVFLVGGFAMLLLAIWSLFERSIQSVGRRSRD